MFSFKFFLLLLAVLATYFSSTLACLQNDAVCKGDGSMGTCCSGFCYQQAGWAEGYCQSVWIPDPNDPLNCNSIAKMPSSITNKCFRKYNYGEQPTGCSHNGGVQAPNNYVDSFTGVFCNCQQNMAGSGHFCTMNCPDRLPAGQKKPPCSNGQICRYAQGSSGQMVCGCQEYEDYKAGKCRFNGTNMCNTCQFNCHLSTKCIPDLKDFRKYRCSECSEIMGFEYKPFAANNRDTWCQNINECANGKHKCDKNAKCDDTDPSDDDTWGIKYKCKCLLGFTGHGTQCSPCIDIDECKLNPTICGPNSICENTIGSYNCKCGPGYQPERNTSVTDTNSGCEDIDECAKKEDHCKAHSKCINTIGSYECPCILGYKGNGKIATCELDDAVCATCDEESTKCVINEPKTAYECQCITQNYQRVNQTHCTPYDHCAHKDKIRCAPEPKATCTNLPNGKGYTCACNSDYIDEGVEMDAGMGYKCLHRDLCKRTAPCSHVANTVCRVTSENNDYLCDCKPGFIRQVADINERTKPCYDEKGPQANNCSLCLENSEVCQDVPGGPGLKQCVCREGYERPQGPGSGDAQCININECIRKDKKTCDPNRGECKDLIPTKNNNFTQFNCSCIPGFEGDGTMNNCKNINECELGIHTCDKKTEKCMDKTPGYECQCQEGYVKRGTQCVDDDECTRAAFYCHPLAKCRNIVGSYECYCDINDNRKQNGTDDKGRPTCGNINICKDGLQGKAESFPACPSVNHMCIPDGNKAQCICKDGFVANGNNCDNINECRNIQLNRCDERTTNCIDKIPGYVCECKTGYTQNKTSPLHSNHFCEDVNECENLKGTKLCNPNSHCVNTAGAYICVCDDGYEIANGTTDSSRPYCIPKNPCLNNISPCYGGVCNYTPKKKPFFKCSCNEGIAKHNDTTCIDSKYCDVTDFYKCPANSKCSLRVCVCDEGFRWVDVPPPITIDRLKLRKCEPIDFCATDGPVVCDKMKCRNKPQPGQGECYCDAGFEKPINEKKCIDINECLSEEAQCPDDTDCYNTIGSYKCECKLGWLSQGGTDLNPKCVDFNECLNSNYHNCSFYKNTICENIEGGFNCMCPPGYKRDQIGGVDYGTELWRACVPVDPCDPSPCQSGIKCQNRGGVPYCECPFGYVGLGTKESPCQDVNECTNGHHNCSVETEFCHNINGGFICNCEKGYKKDQSGSKCIDIDECRINMSACPDPLTECSNTAGSFKCNCKNGYVMNSNGKCEDLNECSTPGQCGPSPANICVNIPGSYNCTCEKGYIKKCNTCVGMYCEDIDECSTSENACGPHAICKNTPGSFMCNCEPNYTGNPNDKTKGCEYISMCDRYPCKKKNAHCEPNADYNTSCVCNTGFIEDINKVCVANPCDKFKCDGGRCILDYKKEPVCYCQKSDEIYDKTSGTCVSSNVCKCLDGKSHCINSSACPEPKNMECKPNVAVANCTCLPHLKQAGQTCVGQDFCRNFPCVIDQSPTECVPIMDVDNKFQVDRQCNCKTAGYMWKPNPLGSLQPGKCIIDKECVQSNFCSGVGNQKCDSNTGLCRCQDGFQREKTGLCEKIDKCEAYKILNGKLPCELPAYGIEEKNMCVCKCPPGYTLECLNNVTRCNDIPECSEKPCAANITHPFCKELMGSYECTCGETPDSIGYTIQKGFCVPPDLCKEKNITCPINSYCISATGKCECNKGYTRYGGSYFEGKITPCEDENECQTYNPVVPENSKCVNIPGDYTAICIDGFEKKLAAKPLITETHNGGKKEWNFTCEDIDECKLGKCGMGTKCFNLPGTFNCTCTQPKQIQVSPQACFEESPKTTNQCTNCSDFSTCIHLAGETTAFNCTCLNKYEGNGVGKNGCKPIPYCDREPKPCHPMAKCTNMNPGYSCTCPEGYEGTGEVESSACRQKNFCITPQNPCPKDATSCQIRAVISDYWKPKDISRALSTCVCPNGFYFDDKTFTCLDEDECEMKKQKQDADHTPCPKNSTCQNTQGGFYCICPIGYTYDMIKNECVDVNECEKGLATSCKLDTGDCRNTIGSWYCYCKQGFQNPLKNNTLCEYIDRCTTSENPCDSQTSICHDAYEAGIQCECKKGYQSSPNEPYKCVDINECAFPNNCSSLTQNCNNFAGGYNCTCRTQYELKNGNCEPLKPCSEKCADYSICVVDRNGNSTCKCIDNYSWIEKNQTCSINSCNDFDCGEGGKCVIIQNRNDSLTNTQLPYRCVCNDGYTLDPVRQLCKKGGDGLKMCQKQKLCGPLGTCIAKDNKDGYDCKCPNSGCWPSCNTTQCHELATCKTAERDGNTVITYCDCKDGYYGFGTIQTGCFKTETCDERLCSKYATCQLNKKGKSECVCAPGYRGNGTYCLDVNECDEKIHNCDTEKATCINVQGGFSCICNQGFTGSGTKGNCKDINECQNKQLHKCELLTTECKNTEPDYYCACKDGFENTTNSFYFCIDTNECTRNQTICGEHECQNLSPFYQCNCKEGYVQTPNKRVCDDIDECTAGTHLCDKNADCFNIPGGYNCSCKNGYTGDGKKCQIKDKCKDQKDNQCNSQTTTCQMIQNSADYVCICKLGYKRPPGQSVVHSCVDIDECTETLKYDPETTICTNLIPGYNMTCIEGYYDKNVNASNADCHPRDECSEDPAFVESMAIYKEGKVEPGDWQTWMIKPKDNSSAYAACYYWALSGNRFGPELLPNCKNLPPKQKMDTFQAARGFILPTGYSCACPDGGLTSIASGVILRPVCSKQKCNCNKGFVCDEGQCVCEDKRQKIRILNGQSVCSDVECDSNYQVPPKLVNKATKIRCVNNTFAPILGYKLIRDKKTLELLDVQDIDECTENKGIDPCCIGNCTGDACVKCINTEGSYTCSFQKDPSLFCERENTDSNSCYCKQYSCGKTEAWYYTCITGNCNATSDSRLNDQKFNKPLCSRVEGNGSLQTFSSLKALYQYVCSLSTQNQNKYACLFDSNNKDLTTSPLFNYWGACTNDKKVVKCEGGGTAEMRYLNGFNALLCPGRFTPMPKIPAVAQPYGQPYSVEPECHQNWLIGNYTVGFFSLDQYANINPAYPL